MLRKIFMLVVITFMATFTLIGNVGAVPPDPEKPSDEAALVSTPCAYPDSYEEEAAGPGTRDDQFGNASLLTTAGQPGHTFDLAADKDWAGFEAEPSYRYTITTENLTPPDVGNGFYADTQLELYEADGVTLLDQNDDYGGTHASRIVWQPSEAGTYYVKVTNYNPTVFGCVVQYDLTLSKESSLQITKSAEDLNGAPLLEGDVIRYTITVTNASTTIQHTNVFITDPIPSGATYVPNSAVSSKGLVTYIPSILQVLVGSMTFGEVVTVQFDVQVDSGTMGQDVVNQAFVRSDQLDVVGTSPVTPPGGGQVEPGLSINKTALDVNGPPVLAGDRISYTIVVTNHSTISHTNVVITDFIPSGTTYVNGSISVGPPGSLVLPVDDILVVNNIGTLAPSADLWVEFAVTVDDGVDKIGGNVAVVSSDQQNAQSTGPVYPENLDIDKGAEDLNGGPLYVGDEILYTVVVANLLDEAQTNVVITDTIPDYTTYVVGSASVSKGSVSGPDPLLANVGTLQAGEKAVLTFRVTVDADAAGQVVGNSAQTSSDQQYPPVDVGPIEPEPSGGTVLLGQPTLFGQQALGIAKAAEDWNGGPLYSGDQVLYTISVVNLLTTTQESVVITDEIPDYTTYVDDSALISQGSVSGPDPLVADVGALGPGQQVTLTFRVTVDAGAMGQIIENSAQATSNAQSPPVVTPPVQPYPDPLPGYPDSGGGWVLDGDQQIGIRKWATDLDGAPLNPNDKIAYTVVIWNEVNRVQTSVVITDYIPAFTTYVLDSVTYTKGAASGPDPLLVAIDILVISERVTVTFQVTVNQDAAGQTITNQAFVGSNLQKPPAYTPPITTPDGGTVTFAAGYEIYLPLVARNF